MLVATLEKNGRNAILIGDQLELVREHFSVENTAYQFTKKINPYSPRRFYAITKAGRVAPSLIPEIAQFLLSQNASPLQLTDPELLHAITPAVLNWKNHSPVAVQLSLTPHDYQTEIVDICMTQGRGVVEVATAGGKTLIMALLLTQLYKVYGPQFRCLVVVPDRGLVSQTHGDFQKYQVPFQISKLTGDDEYVPANVVIANLGILQSKNTDMKWLNGVDVLVVDEVHKLRRRNEVNNILDDIKTPHRFGFTGTMPEDKLDQWNIIGKIGPRLYQKSSFSLRQSNLISEVLVQALTLHYSAASRLRLRATVGDEYRAELEHIITNTFRNTLITKLTANTDNNTLILVDFIRHGTLLYDTIRAACPTKQVFFIRGEVEVEDRDKVRVLMEKSTDVVVVAISKIFSTGINIQNLHYIIFAGGGKAKIKVVQSIGRGLRKHVSKTRLVVFDLIDQLQYGIKHAIKRLELYKRERIPVTNKDCYER